MAAEVRNLAQRSASAAREIKTLIGSSVEQVGAGTDLVGQARTTMNEIVGAIEQVNRLMADINSATVEQTSGITQAGQAANSSSRPERADRTDGA